MNRQATAIRSFIGSKNYSTSRAFYNALGFKETVLTPALSLFTIKDKIAFYLQDAYVKEWIENTMLFVEVTDLEKYLEEMQALNLPARFKDVKLSDIVRQEWGAEFFLHDPAGVLWHFGTFN